MKIIKYDVIVALIIGLGAVAAFYGTLYFEGILKYVCGFLFGSLGGFLIIWSFDTIRNVKKRKKSAFRG